MTSPTLHPDQAHAAQHWNSEYFGEGKAIAVAQRKYEEVWERRIKGEVDVLDLNAVVMGLISTLLSALNSELASILRMRKSMRLLLKRPREFFAEFFTRLERVEDTADELNERIESMWDQLDFLVSSEKEVMMAALLRVRWFQPLSFLLYRRVGLLLGEEVIFSSYSEEITKLLVKARLAGLWFYWKRDIYRKEIKSRLDWEDLHPTLEPETTARLARLIGEKKLQQKFATRSGKKDAILKSGA